MVAVRLLEHEGAQVSVAGDGRQGLEAMQAASAGYHLVLMDMQMPVMDGLEATRAIRRLPGHAALPIVAMTANAMQSDRDACIAAGMNAHIGKPFELDALVEVILQLTGHGAEDSPTLLQPTMTRAPSPTPAILDTESALKRLEHDTGFYARLLNDFAPSARRLLQEITDAARRNDIAGAGAAAHQLKSTAAALGALELAAACAAIEQGAHTEMSPQTLQTHTRRLQAALEHALAAQAAWLQSAQACPPLIQTSPADYAVILTALGEALRVNDMQALDLFDELLASYAGPPDPGLQALQKAMDDFDTDSALRIVMHLRARFSADSIL